VAALGLALASGCPDREPAAGHPVRPVFCYRSLTRTAPGVLDLSDPIPCTSGDRRWRAQGPRDRSDAVDLLASDGQVQMSYRIAYRPGGGVAWEERRYQQRPDSVTVYELGKRYEFKTGPAGRWEEVLIRTELDGSGRPVRVDKKVGGRLEFRVTKTYDQTGLREEATYDADGTLRLKRRFVEENGKHYEEMTDGKGKLILRRQAPQDPASGPARSPGSEPDGGSDGRPDAPSQSP